MPKIQLLNPVPGKKGAAIDELKYLVVKETILTIINERGIVQFGDLLDEVGNRLKGSFDGSPSWYCTAVKLDLEARGEIVRIKGSKPQKLQAAKK
ncbi:DUF6958 family protein [Bacillus sp. FJAT-27245]|uniref:DUF6958 family protein n=1 Tax=Bacillus sp. FJAT-27245 TaxID=1684144 RepID=UPI0006A7BDB3|nr:hypothetical protein [Bacillus sp. FJAT-27245]